MSRGKEHEDIPGGKEASLKASKKEQGQHNDPHAAAGRSRGLGSEYAYAIMNAKEQARQMKGSKSGFLGKEKQSIEVKELASANVAYKGKKK